MLIINDDAGFGYLRKVERQKPVRDESQGFCRKLHIWAEIYKDVYFRKLTEERGKSMHGRAEAQGAPCAADAA